MSFKFLLCMEELCMRVVPVAVAVPSSAMVNVASMILSVCPRDSLYFNCKLGT